MPDNGRPKVHGIEVDANGRCAHYHSRLDIVAIKMKCCGTYYACKDCHVSLANHTIEQWTRPEWGERAILCGACGEELTIDAYMKSSQSVEGSNENGDCTDYHRCPACAADFNPKCRNHYSFYFQMQS